MLYIKGYDCESKSKRPPQRSNLHRSRKVGQRRECEVTEVPVEDEPLVEDETLLQENIELDYVASASPADTDHEASSLVESAT